MIFDRFDRMRNAGQRSYSTLKEIYRIWGPLMNTDNGIGSALVNEMREIIKEVEATK